MRTAVLRRQFILRSAAVSKGPAAAFQIRKPLIHRRQSGWSVGHSRAPLNEKRSLAGRPWNN
jgi:hypothetical protein